MKRKTTYSKMQSRDLFFEEDKTRDAVKAVGMTPVVCEKGFRNRPLTDEQKADNRRKS